MVAAAILKAVGHFWFCIFDFGWKSGNYYSNFIGIRRKLTELLRSSFSKRASAAILDLMIGDI
jgi:hypothetical protein